MNSCHTVRTPLYADNSPHADSITKSNHLLSHQSALMPFILPVLISYLLWWKPPVAVLSNPLSVFFAIQNLELVFSAGYPVSSKNPLCNIPCLKKLFVSSWPLRNLFISYCRAQKCWNSNLRRVTSVTWCWQVVIAQLAKLLAGFYPEHIFKRLRRSEQEFWEDCHLEAGDWQGIGFFA